MPELALEQMVHFGIDPDSSHGAVLRRSAEALYRTHADITELWDITESTLGELDRTDRVAFFNAMKFLSFQIAKILDTLQNPSRKTYQHLGYSGASLAARGPYPVFDNVTAIFSANPVVVRTATYIYACTEWVDDAFHGKEALHTIYSRLLNPTSISLSNHIIDLEAGDYASEYLAWNFSSGMAAIDGTLSNVLSHGDIVLSSRNVYGGTYQLLNDFYARKNKFDVALEWFDGYTVDEFCSALAGVRARHEDKLEAGARLVVFMESPCNPHGYSMDVPAICKAAHEVGCTVIVDSTVATPFLSRPLRRVDRTERPDYLIHSYTKDLTGNGNVTAGVVIAENHLMFQPKGGEANGVRWDDTMFWSVYYIKGAFLSAEGAFEVLSGMKTLDLRMTRKCINTTVLARYLDSHPRVNVACNGLDEDPNAEIRKRSMRVGLPAPLFTIDFERSGVSRDAFVRFFDCLSPAFDHQVTLGQSNTVILCPAFTSHSELDEAALAAAGISPTTIRISVGDENPIDLIEHFVAAARLALDPDVPGFSDGFLDSDAVRRLAKEVYMEVHGRLINADQP